MSITNLKLQVQKSGYNSIGNVIIIMAFPNFVYIC